MPRDPRLERGSRKHPAHTLALQNPPKQPRCSPPSPASSCMLAKDQLWLLG